MKKLINVLIIVILFSITSTFSEAVVTANSNKLEGMLFKAQTRGKLRVIVTFRVPGIKHLTLNSTRFRTGETKGSLMKQKAYDADLMLKKAIFDSGDQILNRINNTDYRITRRYSTVPFIALSASPESLLILKDLPEVISINEDILIRIPKEKPSGTNGPGTDKPALDDSTQIVGATLAWSMGITGKGWYVAILDTGIRKTHEMFNGKNIVEACYSGEGNCPNGSTQMVGDGAAAHYYQYNYLSGFDHGSHVSGIAAGNNGQNLFGVSKDSNIIAIQVFSYFPSEDDILSWSSDQIKGLEFVYQQRNNYNIAAANLSLGGGSYSSFCDNLSSQYKAAVDNLVSAGIATVIATGNDHYCKFVSHPACISSAIAVGATAKNDAEANFSNWKKGMVDLFAPGVSIKSSTGGSDISYGSWQGTSMATPHVTGAWALLKQLDMNMSVSKALKLLQDKGKNVLTNCGSGGSQSRIDVGESILSQLTLAPPLNFAGSKEKNNALLQVEYLNKLTWATNPFNTNKGKNIAKYKIYLVDGTNLNYLSEVDGNTFEYLHRKVGKDTSYSYAVKAVSDQGEESIPSYIDVK